MAQQKMPFDQTKAWDKIKKVFDWTPSFNLIIIGLNLGPDAYGFPGNIEEIVSFEIETDFTVDAFEVLYTEDEMEAIYQQALKKLAEYATSLARLQHNSL